MKLLLPREERNTPASGERQPPDGVENQGADAPRSPRNVTSFPASVIVRLSIAFASLFLFEGCGNDKPTPAEIPKQLLNPPTTRPIPSGSTKPPATSQLAYPPRNA
jgi:hypothetical protein